MPVILWLMAIAGTTTLAYQAGKAKASSGK